VIANAQNFINRHLHTGILARFAAVSGFPQCPAGLPPLAPAQHRAPAGRPSQWAFAATDTAALQSGSGGLLLAAASPRPLRTAAQVSLSLQTSTVCCTLLINRACTFQLSRPGSVPAVGCCTSRRVIAQPLPSAPWSTPSLARAQFAAPCLRW
jgi:hypothetical protein